MVPAHQADELLVPASDRTPWNVRGIARLALTLLNPPALHEAIALRVDADLSRSAPNQKALRPVATDVPSVQPVLTNGGEALS